MTWLNCIVDGKRNAFGLRPQRLWLIPSPCGATGTELRRLLPRPPEDGKDERGSLHLTLAPAIFCAALKVIPSNGERADSLPNHHEGTIYLKGWGMANEPVYNQQGTAYLLRDDAKAAIRTFYSYMAAAFSHSAYEPVEHRWTHGQYFGPPSTDGAWFELFRNMLVREVDDHTLLLAQATPRKWLEDGKKIEVRKAPTYFGPVSLQIESQARSGKILATVEFE